VEQNSSQSITTDLTGASLVETPLLNKGTAFTEEERRELGLLGLLPPHVENLEKQAVRAYDAFSQKTVNIEKYIYLRQLQDANETLFYRLVADHISEMLPIIYTPVVGEACQRFSEIYRKPRGIFISYPECECIDEILGNWHLPDVRVIVVTDGERILGLGDQGAGGMGIPIGKLSLYTAVGGIHPAQTLPICLDVGTNNQERLDDPTYIGWRHERITGEAYDEFIDKFVQGVMRRFPDVLLQWEDFASKNAAPIITRYRDKLCTFNDDIQGTAAVTTGALLAAVAVTGTEITDQRVAMLGAGSAGVGISNELVAAMMKGGLSEADARSRFYLIDSHGLIHDRRTGLAPYKQAFAQKKSNLSDWNVAGGDEISFEETVRNAKPTILVGVTGQPGVFTEAVVREMASHVQRPIIFPLSNPTSRCEALPEDLIGWTDGKALVATGSPFDPVPHNGREIPIAQCNNSYIFPAMGTAVVATGARRVSNEMFMAAAHALRDCSPTLQNAEASLLPPLEGICKTARNIALAVGSEAQQQGFAGKTSREELEKRVDETMWVPAYVQIRRQT